MTPTPAPGSPAAVEKGCICPVEENANGAGQPHHFETWFWMNADCPLHGAKDGETDGND